MATNKKATKTSVVASARQLFAGTTKHLANETQVKFAGGSYTPAQILDKLQSIVNLRDGVDAAKASTKAKLETEKAEMPALRTFTGALVAYVKALYATQPETLADFGIPLKKARAPLSAEAKTAAAAKRKATRAARNVMGSKQRTKVKGAVVGITVTPVTAPAPQPAATTSSSHEAPATSTGTTTAPTPPR